MREEREQERMSRRREGGRERGREGRKGELGIFPGASQAISRPMGSGSHFTADQWV